MPVKSTLPTSAPSEPLRRAQGCALLLILTLAAALRVHDLTERSFWIDEFCSVQLCTGRGTVGQNLPANVVLDPAPNLVGPGQDGPAWKVWTTLREDVFPPLYYVLLRGWRGLFGPGDAAARSLSVVASLTGILLLFAVGRRLHGAGPALWACLIMALATPQIQYAQEARGYALLTMWGLACIWAFLRIYPLSPVLRGEGRGEGRDVEGGEARKQSSNPPFLTTRPSPQPSPLSTGERGPELGRYILFTACLLAAMLTHYYAAGPLSGLAAFAVVRWRGRLRRNVLLTFVTAGVVYLVIWGPFLWQQMHATIITSSWSLEPREGNLWHTLLRVGVLPYECLGPRLAHSDRVAAVSGVLFVLPFAMARRRPDLLLWGFWMAGATGLVAAGDLWRSGRQLEYIRYTLSAAPGIYMVIASILWNRNGRALWLRHALPLIAALCCLVNVPQAYVPDNADKPDWRVLADYVRKNQQPGDAYVFASLADHQMAVSQAGIYYDGITHYTGPLPGPALVLYARATPEQQAALKRASGTGHIWIVAGLGVDSPDAVLPGAEVKRSEYSPGLGSVWEVSLKTKQ